MMKELRFWLFILLVIVIGCWIQSPDSLEPSARQAFTRADEFYARHDVNQAEQQLRLAVTKSKRKTDCYVAAFYRSVMDSNVAGLRAKETAAGLARELLDLNDKNKLDRRLGDYETLRLLINYSDLCCDLHRSSDARDAMSRAITLVHNDPAMANEVGYRCLELDHRYSDAFRLTKIAVAGDPTNASYIDSLGWAYYKLGRYKNAQYELRRAVSLCNDSADIRYHLATTNFKVGKLTEARIEAEKALACNPFMPEARRLDAVLTTFHGGK